MKRPRIYWLPYLWYVLKHRWFVMVECWRCGLWWQGIVHDLSKFRPDEFVPYAEHFHGPKRKAWRDKTGYYKPTDTGDPAFDFAWLLHQKRNDHHWQWWVLPEDAGGVKILRMSAPARTEMLCDWIGASRAQGHGGMEGKAGVRAWYRKNGKKMQLEAETRALVVAHILGRAGIWK
jgi:hypothetical protein